MPSTTEDARLPAEQPARVRIDRQLEDASWVVQSRGELNLFVDRGVARREVTMAPGHGHVDPLLYVDKAVVGVIEAKREGTTLSGVEWQSSRYAVGLPDDVRRKVLTAGGTLPFVFEANGPEIHSTNGFDPEPRTRPVFGFPRPSPWPSRCGRSARARSPSPGVGGFAPCHCCGTRVSGRRRSHPWTAWSAACGSNTSTGR